MQRKGSTFPDRRLLADRAGASFFNLQNFPGYGESTCSIIWFIVKMSKQTLCFHYIDKGIRISFFHYFPDFFTLCTGDDRVYYLSFCMLIRSFAIQNGGTVIGSF